MEVISRLRQEQIVESIAGADAEESLTFMPAPNSKISPNAEMTDALVIPNVSEESITPVSTPH